VFQQHFEQLDDAAAAELQVKGRRREKKEALIRGDYAVLPALARRRTSMKHPSRQRAVHASSG
jgi:putative endonuclease